MKFARMMRHAARPVVDLVLPETCWAGGGGEAAFGLSQDMRDRIAMLAAQRYCFHCGLTLGPFEAHDERNPCARCGLRDAGAVRIARVGTFTDPLVALVHRLKFGRAWEVAGVLAPLIYQAMMRVSEAARVEVGVMVPVPLHWSRRARRGFNQAEELARQVAALSGWKIAPALRRSRPTLEQTRIDSPAQRRENLRGAFTTRGRAGLHVAGKHVWLIDDVTTTGATLLAAASALRRLPKQERPASINAAVVCVTDPKAPPAAAGPQAAIANQKAAHNAVTAPPSESPGA